MQPNPYEAPATVPQTPSLPTASPVEMRASAFALYLYFVAIEQVFLLLLMLTGGPKTSALVFGGLVATVAFFVRASFLAARAMRKLGPQYLILLRRLQWFALGWVVLYASRAMHGRVTLDLTVAMVRLLFLGAIYHWTYARTVEGALQQRSADATKIPAKSGLAWGAILLHLVTYPVGLAISRH